MDLKILASTVSTVLFLSACAGGDVSAEADAQEGVSVTQEVLSPCGNERPGDSVAEVAVATNSGPQAAPFVLWAESVGCFDSYNLEVTLKQMGAPADRTAALLGKSADIAWLTVDPIVAGTANASLDYVLVSPHTGYSEERLELARAADTFEPPLIVEGVVLSRPGLSLDTFSELEGKSIGRQSAITNVGVDNFLLERGVNLDTIRFVDVEQVERLEGLLRGDLDAAALSGVYATRAIREGAGFLFYYPAWERIGGPADYWVTTPELVERNSIGIDRFREAMWKVYELLSEPAYREEFISFLVAEYGGSEEDTPMVSLRDFYPRPVEVSDLEPYFELLYRQGTIDMEVDLDSTTLLDY